MSSHASESRPDGDDVPHNAFRVLLTGFGPFMHYNENPSWLAVRPLQNVMLTTAINPEKVEASNASASASSKATSSSSTTTPKVSISPIEVPASPRPIHITTLQIPVLYESVVEKVPPLLLRPPVLPPDAPEDCIPPPQNGYDFVFHIGVAGRGPLRMERLGHRLGYHMKDASGKYAPVVKVVAKDFSRREGGAGAGGGGGGGGGGAAAASGAGGGGGGGGGRGYGPSGNGSLNGSIIAAGIISHGTMTTTFAAHGGPPSPTESLDEVFEKEKYGMYVVDGSFFGSATGDAMVRPARGFGIGYETCQDEYTTDIDVTRLVSDLKKDGVEQIYSSMDAGHYLCDFIYYCSLAEVKRTVNPYEEKRRTPQVLFLHCPPIGQPLTTEEVTDAIKKIIVWVCAEIWIQQLRDEAAVAAGVAAGAPPVPGAVRPVAKLTARSMKKPGPLGGPRA